MSLNALSDNFCPDVLHGGGCQDTSCPLLHDVRICEVCVVICAPASNYDSHCQGQRHRANLVANDYDYVVGPAKGQTRRCAVCGVTVHLDQWNDHLVARSHREHQQLAALRAAYDQSESDKQGVTVSHLDAGIDFGLISLDQAKEGLVTEVNVSTKSTNPVSILLTDVRSRVANHAPLFTVSSIGPALTVTRGIPLRFTVHFRHTDLGRYEARLEFTFQGASRRPFVIARRILAVVGESADRELLQPVAPYIRSRRAPWRDDTPVLPGSAPMGPTTKWARDLSTYPIPAALSEVLRAVSLDEVMARLYEAYFPEPLSNTNHSKYFSNLLWIEEKRHSEDLRMYDMIGVELTQEGRLYTLPIHGLSEKRPSVVMGDTIMVQAQAGGSTFKGVVHDVRQDAVRLSFHPAFQGLGERFNVRFQLNRTILRRQHQALVAKVPDSKRLLFPDPGDEGLEKPVEGDESRVALFNSAIGKNDAQLLAVTSILHLKSGVAPFIVFGPPGTGKTVTIVEAIRQILQHYPEARILACAPSNSAADIIAQRLSILSRDELFRCNAMTRDPGTVPPDLGPYTYLRETGFYGLPSLDTLSKFKVIVSTCSNASFAYNIGMPAGHFTHVFVDEAGQASEPEVLVAVKPLTRSNTRIILSGDPKQLGPVIHSSIAREFRMDKSYLERLMELPMYSNAEGRGRAYIKLTKNYRSHGAILSYPNEQFYDGELEVCGASATINTFLNSPQLVSPRFPAVFHAISGRNERESSSPSYFNVDEAIQAKAIIRSLLEDRRFPVKPREIGVIAPYHAQVRKIRRLLHDARLGEIKVGSVEEFQGQERKVIIVTTVRSSTNLLAYDAKFTLGFLANARRFNVAMTRAQALLIVIGDAAILSVDPIWRGFMNYIYLHDGWRGDSPTWDPQAPVSLDANYIDELREAIATEMNELIAQLPPGDDLEAEANLERPVWNSESDAADW